MFAGVLISLISHAYFDSNSSTSGKLNVLVNEILIMFTLYTILCFSHFLPNEFVKFIVGYVSCLLIIVHLLVNLSLMFTGSIHLLILKLKRILYRLRHKRKQPSIVPNQQTQEMMQRQKECRLIMMAKQIEI